MSGECQVNVKSQSELDIGGRETCIVIDLRVSGGALLEKVHTDAKALRESFRDSPREFKSSSGLSKSTNLEKEELCPVGTC